MYEAFYELTERPFNFTPDPHFLYPSNQHKEAIAHLLYGIQRRSGFVMLTGEIGTGKTTLCRALLEQLGPDTEVAYIFDPSLYPDELLRKINREFGINSTGSTFKELNDELNGYLIERNTDGKNCVLLIDEAHNLTPGALEQIRLLSNLETETRKLLQIVLVGQPELLQHLQLTRLRQLNQRIVVRYHLTQLDRNETAEYVAYRLSVAGEQNTVHFMRGALRAIYRFSAGTPRLINAICDRALLVGYTLKTRDITAVIVERAAKEIRGESVELRKGVLGNLLAPLFTAQPAKAGQPSTPETGEEEATVEKDDAVPQADIGKAEDSMRDTVDAALPGEVDAACGRFDWPAVPDQDYSVEKDAEPDERVLVPMETAASAPEIRENEDAAKGDDFMPQQDMGTGEGLSRDPAGANVVKSAAPKAQRGGGEYLNRTSQVLVKINSVEECSMAVLQKVDAVVSALAGPSAQKPKGPESGTAAPRGLYEEMEARLALIQQHLISISETMDRL